MSCHCCSCCCLWVLSFPISPELLTVPLLSSHPVLPTPGKGAGAVLDGWQQAAARHPAFLLITGFPWMQLEHAILILFPAIWPLAGLKYDSINYCQESPGARPFSGRRFGGAPGVLTGLFSPLAVGFSSSAGPTKPGTTPSCSLAPDLGRFKAFPALKEDAMGCSPGTRVWQAQHHLDNDWRQPLPQKWDIPTCGPHTCPSSLPDYSLGASSFAPSGSGTSTEDLLGFSLCSHELVVASWGTFGIWGR